MFGFERTGRADLMGRQRPYRCWRCPLPPRLGASRRAVPAPTRTWPARWVSRACRSRAHRAPPPPPHPLARVLQLKAPDPDPTELHDAHARRLPVPRIPPRVARPAMTTARPDSAPNRMRSHGAAFELSPPRRIASDAPRLIRLAGERSDRAQGPGARRDGAEPGRRPGQLSGGLSAGEDHGGAWGAEQPSSSFTASLPPGRRATSSR